MATPIEETGYESLREFIMSTDGWTHIGVNNDDGDELLRVEIDSDDRAEWTTDETDQTLELELILAGDDDDVTDERDSNDGEITIVESALYTDGDTEDPVAVDGASSATIANDDDEVLVRPTINVPPEE